jgi:hypothetical protein
LYTGFGSYSYDRLIKVNGKVTYADENQFKATDSLHYIDLGVIIVDTISGQNGGYNSSYQNLLSNQNGNFGKLAFTFLSNDSTQKYNEQCNIVVEPDCSSTCASRKENE